MVPFFLPSRYHGRLNHAYQTKIRGVCNFNDHNNYKICTKQTNATDECLGRTEGGMNEQREQLLSKECMDLLYHTYV